MIIDNENHFSTSLMCRLLSVSRSGYYGWRHRPPSARERSSQLLKIEIKRVFDDEKGRPGSPRVARRLKAEGILAGRLAGGSGDDLLIGGAPHSQDHAAQWLAREGGQEIQGDHQQQALLASSP